MLAHVIHEKLLGNFIALIAFTMNYWAFLIFLRMAAACHTSLCNNNEFAYDLYIQADTVKIY